MGPFGRPFGRAFFFCAGSALGGASGTLLTVALPRLDDSDPSEPDEADDAGDAVRPRLPLRTPFFGDARFFAALAFVVTFSGLGWTFSGESGPKGWQGNRVVRVRLGWVGLGWVGDR